MVVIKKKQVSKKNKCDMSSAIMCNKTNLTLTERTRRKYS